MQTAKPVDPAFVLIVEPTADPNAEMIAGADCQVKRGADCLTGCLADLADAEPTVEPAAF